MNIMSAKEAALADNIAIKIVSLMHELISQTFVYAIPETPNNSFVDKYRVIRRWKRTDFNWYVALTVTDNGEYYWCLTE